VTAHRIGFVAYEERVAPPLPRRVQAGFVVGRRVASVRHEAPAGSAPSDAVGQHRLEPWSNWRGELG